MKTNFKRIGKQSISIVLAVMMMLSTMLVGMVTSNAADDATATVYTTLDSISEFSSYINSDGSLKSGYTLKANTQYGGSGEGLKIWKQVDATKYTKKINGKTVYTADVGYYSDWGGLNTLQFQIYSGSNQEKSVAIINKTWTVIDTIKDMYWNGSSWSKPTWDSEQPTTQPQETTAPTQPSGSKAYTLYVRNTKNWSDVYVYIWSSSDTNNNTWHGVKMEKLAGTDNVYYYVLPDTTNTNGNCIFNNNSKEQSADLVLKDQLGKIYDNSSGKTSDYEPPVVKHSVKLAADSSANATVTVNNSELPVEVAENATYSLTVTPNENYYIKKITVGGKVEFTQTDDNYADSKNAITISDLKMGTADVEVKVEAVTAPVPVVLTATLVDGDRGSAYIASYTDNETGETVTNTDKTLISVNAKPGNQVTFYAESVDGYFPKWSFGGKSSVGNTFTLDGTSVTGTTPVTVYLTYEKIENHNIIVESNKGGKVNYTYNDTTNTVAENTTSSPISVASNSTITLKANADTAKNYVFSGWKFDNPTNVVFADGQDALSPSITISVVDDVKVTATFEEQSGTVSNWKFMLSDSDKKLVEDSTGTYTTSYPVYEKADGTYSVTFPVSAISSNTTQYFTFSKTGDNTGFEPGDARLDVKIADNFKQYVKEAKKKEWGQKYVVLASFQNTDDIDTINVTYNPKTYTYTIDGSCYVLPENSHKVYATMGSSVGLKYGKTTISLLNGQAPLKTYKKDYYNQYIVNADEQITVECQMNSTEANLGYYVYAFVVNGEKVDVVDNGNNVYQTAAPITVTEDLEITPIYYNKQIEADGNYITIYTNAPAELQTLWGNSISIYSWYKGDDGKYLEMDGAYPGQLMMRDSQGRFAAKVSKYAYTNVDGKFTCDKSKQVLGITNNNYYENEDVHNNFLTTAAQKVNNQTYDYDDFEKLTGMGYDTVEFDVKYYADKTESNQKLLVDNATNNKPMAGKPIIPQTATKYEDLTNIDGKLVSILGYTNETAKPKNDTGLITGEPLKIISVGNQNMKIGDSYNIWSTIWYVYKSNGDYVTQGMPSDFIPRGSVDKDGNFTEGDISEQTTAYQAIVKAGLQYNSAVISYEVKMDATTSADKENTGVRIDGRWYYARSTDQVDAKVGIIYRNSENDVWTVDKASADSEITGKVTGGSASFDYTDSVGSSHTNLASASVERNTIITLNATNGSTYKFIGWATPIYNEAGKVTGYSPLTITDLTASYQVSTTTDLFAMYEPYPTGYVTITHSKYTGPDSHNGLGIFSVTAKVFDAKGNPVDSQVIDAQSTLNTVTLKNIVNKNDGSYIEVTLTTQSYAKSHFLNFYYPSVAGGVSTLKKDDKITEFYDKECTTENPATKKFRVNVSDLFDGNTQKVMALNYYSDLKLPDVDSNITFNYNPYSTAPNPNPAASKGSGKTTFTITIKDKDGKVVYTSAENISSLTLKANDNIKSIVQDYVATGSDYTITITMNPVADSHCSLGQSYYQQNDSGTYTYKKVDNTVDIKLSDLYDKVNNKFNTNTVNLYTDFGADVFNYNVTFKYLGYESRQYYNTNGFKQEQIPEGDIDKNWWKTYTVSGTFYGTDIDKYFEYVDGQYKFKESFLLKVAPYEDNFVQSITWDLSNVDYTATNDILSVTATVPAKYKNDFVTVTADLGNGKDKKIYSVNYASLVTADNLISPSTESNENSESKYLIVAPEINANGEKFSYWTIQTDDSNGIEVAKCYTREFNFLAYDNYLITACYGKEDVDASKKGVSATMQFLEYSRNQYDTGKDRVYADFAVAYNYEHLLLQESNNPNIVCGVAFVLNSSHKSDGNAVDTTFTVDSAALYNKVKDLNDKTTTDKMLPDGSKVFNYVIDKKNLDNKNRIEYNWSVDNLPANQQLTLLAYSYIYDTSTGKYSVSAPQSFKFYEVGNKSYEA
ncbi:starch-binding protein [Ruminococcus sp.]